MIQELTPLWFWEYHWKPPVIPEGADWWWQNNDFGSYSYGYIRRTFERIKLTDPWPEE